MALAPEQEPAELLLELLDGAGQRRLGDVAVLGGAGEVERLAHREEVADLVHLHRGHSTSAGACSGGINLVSIGISHSDAAAEPYASSLPS